MNNNGNETVTYYHQDHLLSTRLLTDETGNIIEEEDYTAFGSDINYTSEKYNLYSLNVSVVNKKLKYMRG